MRSRSISVIIPTLDEAGVLPGLLADLKQVELPLEIVVADGGSADATPDVALRGGARLVRAPRGRARQMNAGAAAAGGAWLCFLHADVRVPAAARRALVAAVRDPALAVAVWRFAIDCGGFWPRFMEFGQRLRERLGGLRYGDQGLLVRRTLFDAAGGFPDLPVMEDVALVRALRRRARIVSLGAAVLVSPRRWQREGPYRAWLRNTALLAAYLLGVAPERLARWYRPEPR